METAEEIVKKATAMRKVIAAAIILTNARFDSQKKKIFKQPLAGGIAEDIKSFRSALEESSLPQEEKSILLASEDHEICDLAKEITLAFTGREIRIN